MTHEYQHPCEPDFGLLEAHLRSLPRADAPDDLLERLLADIPKSRKRASIPVEAFVPRRFYAAAAAVLLVAAAIAVAPHRPGAEEDLQVSAEYVLYRPIELVRQETDPCSILPPLPAPPRS